MAKYNSGAIYDTGIIYSASENSPIPAEPGNTASLTSPTHFEISDGTNNNAISKFARAVEVDNNISSSVSDTYNADDLSLANSKSSSGRESTESFGVKVLDGNDVSMQQVVRKDKITIPNVGSRFMR